MPINRKAIATNADDEDIFVLDRPRRSFINFGDLTTSGDFANAILVTADHVSVHNLGNLTTSGAGAVAIQAGDWLNPGDGVDDASIFNHGTILVSGDFGDADGDEDISPGDHFPDGIAVYGDRAHVINFGSITVLNPFGSGMAVVGSGATVRNFGSIDVTGFGIVLDALDGSESGNLVVNHGHIHTSGEGFARGIAVFSSGNQIVNRGLITVDGFHDFGMSLEGEGNHGFNHGTIVAAGAEARGVLLFGADHEFTNFGLIETTGPDSVGIRIDADAPEGIETGLFVNRGSVESVGFAVLGSSGNEQIVNRGAMTGDVDLGGGDDRFVAARGGDLDGFLFLGDGDDLVIVERRSGGLVIGDFEAGAGSDDVVDLSAFRLDSFGELLSNAVQSGADVVIALGGGDEIVLQNVTLASLAATDFIIG